jgi:hypothetical protein
MQSGQPDAAAASFRRAIELEPGHVEAHYNLANALVELVRLPEAEQEFRKALALAPTDADSLNNLGTLLQFTGRYHEALLAFDAALRARPQWAEARYNRAMLQLLRGDYQAAWDDYDYRFARRGATVPEFREPRWQGQPLAGRTIVLWCEQGLGDIVQMIRYAPLLAERGATVLVECPPAIVPLLSSVAGIDRFVDTRSEQVKFDYYIPLLNLPSALGTRIDTIPADVPYLSVERAQIDQWRRKLAAYDGFKVGIAWQGNPGYTGDRHRSIPLAEFAPLAAVPGVRLVSLQKGYGSEQLPPLAERLGIVDLGATLDEGTGAFVETAAAILNLDLVVTSDTSLAHVAGALAAPAWLALQLSPNWRWGCQGNSTPWYPTMRLFRQSTLGDWPGVFERMAVAIRELVAAGDRPSR